MVCPMTPHRFLVGTRPMVYPINNLSISAVIFFIYGFHGMPMGYLMRAFRGVIN